MRILYNLDGRRAGRAWSARRDETRRAAAAERGRARSRPWWRARSSPRLERLGADTPELQQRLARLEVVRARWPTRRRQDAQRTPYFCSGCPHNTSTKVPEGSRALAGIGCHFMAHLDADRRTATFTPDGRRRRRLDRPGAVHRRARTSSRISATAPISIRGLLAIRAAAAAGVNITYKILYNDAVAMTGGQPVEGHLTRAADHPPGRGRRRQEDRRRHRRARQISDATPDFAARRRRSATATSSTRCSASCARSRASPS